MTVKGLVPKNLLSLYAFTLKNLFRAFFGYRILYYFGCTLQN
jgi:hypothetical protein